MPSIYSPHHERLLQIKKDKSSHSFGKKKDIFIFGKHKNGFIFPTYLNIAYLSTMNDEKMLAAKFTQEIHNTNVGYILCDFQTNIIAVSSSITNWLK